MPAPTVTTKKNSGAPQAGNVYEAYFVVNAAAPVTLLPISDPHGIANGMTFDDQGASTKVEDWFFMWDDDSLVYRVMQETIWFLEQNQPELENTPNFLNVEYIHNGDENNAHVSVCYIDDAQTAEATLHSIKTTLASGEFTTVHSFDWVKVTLINPRLGSQPMTI